eukprot:COSAG04_NODE_3437_length_2815_cov_14.638807_3_plen_162_part_00
MARRRGGPERDAEAREMRELCALGERLAEQGWAARGWDGRRGLADLRTGRAGLETAQTAARPHDDVVRPPGPALPLSCRRSPKSARPIPILRCSCWLSVAFGSLPAQLRGQKCRGRSATHAGAGAREQRRARGATARPRRVVSGAAPERRPAGAPTPPPGP